MEETQYEKGWRAGWWTPEQVKQLGFGSPSACLEHQEQAHQEGVAELPSYPDRAYAAIQAEFLAGSIAATRKSLGQMIADGL